MISKEATLLFAKIADNITESGYVVKDWSELFALLGESRPKDDKLKEMWEQIKFYGYVVQKFKDDEQVCFAITDKGKLYQEELKTVAVGLTKDGVALQIDKLGRPIIVGTEKFAKKVAVFFKRKWADIVVGLVSGLLGGIIGGVIIAVIMR